MAQAQDTLYTDEVQQVIAQALREGDSHHRMSQVTPVLQELRDEDSLVGVFRLLDAHACDGMDLRDRLHSGLQKQEPSLARQYVLNNMEPR